MEFSPIQILILCIILIAFMFPKVTEYIRQRAKQKTNSKISRMVQQRDISGLSDALTDPDHYVRELAAEAFDQIGLPDISAIKARYYIARGEFDLITSLGDHAIEPLISALQLPDTGVISGAAYALAKVGNAIGVQPIIDATLMIDPRAISNIANALGKFKDPIAIKRLTDSLNNTNASIRWVTVNALGEIGERQALSELKRMAKDDEGITYDNGTVKEAASIAIEKIQMRGRTLNQLLEDLDDPNETIRFCAANELGKRKQDKETIAKGLIKSLSDSDQNVLTAAITALGETGYPQAIKPLTKIVHNNKVMRWLALDSIEKTKGMPVELLIELLNDPDPNTRYSAVRRLGKSKDESAVDALERVLHKHQYQEPDLGVRLARAFKRGGSRQPDSKEFWNKLIRDAAIKGIQDIQLRIANDR